MPETVIIIIALYIIIVFILIRLFIPHFGFKCKSLPDKIPLEMEKVINELKSKAKSAGEFLALAYDYLGSKYRSERFNTVLKFHYLFKDLDEVWTRSGYLPCSQSNYIMKIFLTRSGFFRASDIKTKHVFVNFVPHQYLRLKINKQWIDIDVGEKQRGLPIGRHLKFFG